MAEPACRDCKEQVNQYRIWVAGGRDGNSPPVPSRTPRPLVKDSGGRCASHWRDEKRRRKDAAHEKRVVKVYGLQPGQYKILYEFQGGVCAICRRATGASRRLSVDHDHVTGLVRGLLCRPCNDLLGHIRDNPATAERIVHYLAVPPAKRLGLQAIHEENR
ncbi:MAG TPA: endonuclease VII domain-containing protein [Acidimicrobiia bacterium]|nr:endonuclease VII domain-containing protein [Acidimicrobiia bacterium]